MSSIETAWSNYIHCTSTSGESLASYNNVENNVENIVRDVLNKEYDIKKKEPVKPPKHFQILRRNIGHFKFYNPDNDEFVGVTLEKVIFNPPATIVLWSDGTRTVVKCRDGEIFDQHTGLAMCVVKKLYGDDFHYILNTYGGKAEETVSINEEK